MKIGIEAQNILTNRRGFSRLKNLLKAFLQLDTRDTWIFFASEDALPQEWALPESVCWENPRRRLRMLHRQGLSWLGARRFRDLAVFHFPTAEVWYSKFAPTIVTLHDLAPLHYPAQFFATEEEKNRYQNHLDFIVKNADAIITVSEFSKGDILKHLTVQQDNISVIYQGFEPGLHTPHPDADSSLLEKFALHSPYFFYCGGLDFRKNVEGLLRAYARYRHHYQGDRLLVIAGEEDSRQKAFCPNLKQCAAEEGVAEWVVFTGWVEDATLGALYRNAEAFVFPSLFEGFGYTPLEALSAKTPVICSRAASLPEVVGDAALMVDATNPEELSHAMAKIVASPMLCEELIQKGLKQLERFSWRLAAQQHYDLYRRVAVEASRA